MHLNTNNTSQIMRQVIYALALGVGASYYFFGWGVVLQIILAVVTAISVEAVFLSIRKLPIYSNISDFSAVLTAVLLAISIPSIAPWWVIVLGTAFAIVFGKQLYGGLGHNLFNPAMLGYAFLLISYPLQMTQWAGGFLSLTESFAVIFNSSSIDAISAATKLDIVKNQLTVSATNELSMNTLSQLWINMGFLLGGAYLLLRRIIFWHIPTAFLLGLVATSSLLVILKVEPYMSPLFHLVSGATMLAAFFIATDPVSSSTTPKGRLIYGFLIGILVVIIRVFGGYPDGVAFAVLLLNMMVPLIDAYTKPKVFGQR